MLKSLKLKAESFDHWVNRVKDALDPNTPKTMNLADLKALLNEADGKKFPKSDLLQTLTAAVEDAEKCSSVIQQLDLNKIRTRTRNSADTKYKLTVEELTLFCEEIDSLACLLDEAKSIRDLLEQTKKFEMESERLLRLPLAECPLQEVKSCIAHGNGLCIELPNLKRTCNREKQVEWFRDVVAYKKKTDYLSLESIKSLIQQGLDLVPHVEMEAELSQLQFILEQSEEWEEKVGSILKSKDSTVLIQVDKLLKEASKIKCYLPSEGHLYDSMKKARDWLRLLEEMNSAEYYPYFNAMEDLIKRGRALALHLVEVDRMNEYLVLATNWKEKTCKVFLRKNSAVNLMEALSPRIHFPANAGKATKAKKTDDEICLTNTMDPVAVVALFKDAEDTEMDMIKVLRSINKEKSLDPNDGRTFCVCNKPLHGVMMQCELCKDWYHSNCVQLPKISTTKYKGNLTSVSLHLGFKDCKYLCPNCFRTKRPRLDVILSLLMSLQKLYVRVPEGEALQCLTERAMNWQDRARQLLQQPELEAAKNKLSLFTQKYMQVASKQQQQLRAEKNTSRPVIKDTDIEMTHFDGEQESIEKDEEIKADEPSTETNSMTASSSPTEDLNSNDEQMMGEHAYSLHLPKVDTNEFILKLNPEIRKQMEDLLMEGDLLEVHLDETFCLWKLFQASRDPEKEPILLDFDVS